MNEAAWRAERDSRSLRYAGRVLDPNWWVLLRADPAYASRYDGQVAILVAANLFGRMTPPYTEERQPDGSIRRIYRAD